MIAAAGLIYAGGESSRFGADKANALLQGQRLIDHVADRIAPQVAALAVAGSVRLAGADGLDDDGAHIGKGPLAGLLAGLKWASDLPNIKWLVTTPCDVPLLPKNLVALLTQNLKDKPTVLNVDERWQTGCALWPTSACKVIEGHLIAGEDLSLHSALKHLHAETLDVEATVLDGAFTNINSQDDLIQLERKLLKSHG